MRQESLSMRFSSRGDKSTSNSVARTGTIVKFSHYTLAGLGKNSGLDWERTPGEIIKACHRCPIK